MTATTTASPVATRDRVGWGDLAWLTWRQHRWLLGGTAVVVVGIAVLALAVAWHIEATGYGGHELFGEWRYLSVSQMLTAMPIMYGALIGVFWAAPLLAREYEQRTYLVVWSQDITPVRWLLGKVVLLGVPAVGLSAALGSSLVVLMNSMNAHSTDYAPFQPFQSEAFEGAPHVQAAYAAFGFALGLVISATTRRVVLSMGLTLVGFFVARTLVSGFWRPYFQPPIRHVEPFDGQGMAYWTDMRGSAWTVNAGYADAAGNEVDFAVTCNGFDTSEELAKCLAENGVPNNFFDYHPVDRAPWFQWFEAGVFAALAGALLALTFFWIRRSHRM